MDLLLLLLLRVEPLLLLFSVELLLLLRFDIVLKLLGNVLLRMKLLQVRIEVLLSVQELILCILVFPNVCGGML